MFLIKQSLKDFGKWQVITKNQTYIYYFSKFSVSKVHLFVGEKQTIEQLFQSVVHPSEIPRSKDCP